MMPEINEKKEKWKKTKQKNLKKCLCLPMTAVVLLHRGKIEKRRKERENTACLRK